MQITNNQIYYYNNIKAQRANLNFTSNPKSPKLRIKPEDFFISISGYDHNIDWAEIVKKLTNKATLLIRQNKSSDEVLPFIAKEMKSANGYVNDYSLRMHTGILRAERKNYGEAGEWDSLITPYTKINKYGIYKNKLDEKIDNPLKNPYKNIDFLTRIEKTSNKDVNNIVHGNYGYLNKALDIISSIYSDLQKNYISKPQNVTNESLSDINKKVAEIRWIMAHATPWERGSDSISNSFIRALYKAMGIKAYPLKQNISLDLQAYSTELSDYIKDFQSYFQHPPKVID